MERLSYLLDTNTVADYLNGISTITERIRHEVANRHLIYLSQPVYYEVLRGLLKAGATRKLRVFEDEFAPQLDWLTLSDADWRQAADYWASATRVGKQLSDVDLLLAALAMRVNAILVSNDSDFDVLPVRRENWRAP